MQNVEQSATGKNYQPGRVHRLAVIASCLVLSITIGCHRSAIENDDEKRQSLTQTDETSQIEPALPPPISPPQTLNDVLIETKGTFAAKRFHESEQRAFVNAGAAPYGHDSYHLPAPMINNESYNAQKENGFIATSNDQLSTFAIDVDTASYANIRRFLNSGQLPPVGAVRIEEMINYFDYSLSPPQAEPFAIHAELGKAPWNESHNLLKISLKAKELDDKDLAPSNLVFLIDVSGSMSQPNKLPLLQKSLYMLVDQLSARDRVTIVTYAGSDSIVLQPTAGDKKEHIREAINSLASGGSTHASSGIHTAYRLAQQAYMPGGNNRVILASDGDFNVGVTSRDELQELIRNKKESKIFLTVLGFGMGNYADDTMELLADSGNGNYAYIDSILEAKKVLVKERASTLFTLARDVKLQIEFNPEIVGAYRLLGYENRLLADEDFNDDSKDAGEIGLGHTVTALYELIPAGDADLPDVDPLKYSLTSTSTAPSQADKGGGYNSEAATIKIRYILPGSPDSVKKELVVKNHPKELAATSDNFRFSASVAGFGMLLKNSEYIGSTNYQQLLLLAKGSRGPDEEGYRAEFIRLLEMASLINPLPDTLVE